MGRRTISGPRSDSRVSRLYATCYMVDGAGMPNRAKTGSLRRGAVYRARGKVKGLSACKATGCKATG
jgi:hypothetical protein